MTQLKTSGLRGLFSLLGLAGLGAASCTTASGADVELRQHTLNFERKGVSYSHDYICAPTIFPEIRIGASILNGGTPGRKRPVSKGWSPIPQWAVVEAGPEKFAVKLACQDQWVGTKHIKDTRGGSLVDFFLYRESGGVPTLYNIPVKQDVTPPSAVTDIPLAGRKIAQEIAALEPLSSMLRPFPNPSLEYPVLVQLSEVLPDTGQRKFQSEPWMINCPDEAPATTERKDQGFTLQGQPALSASTSLSQCRFIKTMDVNDIDLADRPLSAYGSRSVHLITPDGTDIFVKASEMPLTGSELFLHAENRGSYRFSLERDPFLETEFYKNYIADPLAKFTAASETGR